MAKELNYAYRKEIQEQMPFTRSNLPPKSIGNKYFKMAKGSKDKTDSESLNRS